MAVQLGTGIVPTGAIANELTNITRRGFIPSLIVQIYNSSPLIAALMDNAQTAFGGIDSITVPVQGAPMVQTQSIDFSGSFNQPPEQQGIFDAQLNICGVGTPISFTGAEAALQLDHTIINRLEAKLNDATNSAVDFISTGLYNNYTDTQQIIGLPGAIDDGTNLVTYAGINRAQSPYWNAYVRNAGAAAPTRALVMQYITGLTKNCGERPTFGVTGAGTWQSLANDYLGLERYVITPNAAFDKSEDGAKSAFTALEVAGVPVFLDPYAPEGTIYFLNSNYTNLHIHEQANFGFTGFQSLIGNYQLGYVGLVLSYLQLMCVKPKANARVSNFTYASL